MTTEAERRFHADMIAAADRLQREIGYNPSRFRKLVADIGGPQAARQLLRGSTASDGFTTLWEHHRLDVSVEAFVLLPWYEDLFTESEGAIAARRLHEHGFDTERFLRRALAERPVWAERDQAAGDDL